MGLHITPLDGRPPAMSMVPAVGTTATRWSGATVLSGVFGEEGLAAARRGQEAFYRGEADRRPRFRWPLPRRTTARSRKHPYASFFRSELAALARSVVLGRRIAEATGAPLVRYWHDQLLLEAPRERKGGVDYQWHAERSRWKTCCCPLMATAWIPLAPVTAEMGSITMVDGTEEDRRIDLPEGWEPEDAARRPVLLEPGDVSLHCWHAVHGNPPNFGDAVRRVLAVHFALGPIRYRAHGRFRHVNERVVRRRDGIPDFEDDRVCPVVWGK